MPQQRQLGQSRPRIIVAEDEPVIRKTLALILNEHGFETRTVQDGESAVALARLWPPQVLLTDVTMPGIGGIDAARQVRECCPGCGIALMTAAPAMLGELEGECTARPYAYGFRLLIKPIQPAQLLEFLDCFASFPRP